MRQLFLIAITFGFIFSASVSRAQDGADIMRGIIGFAAGEIERQQRRKQQKRANQRLHQQFTASWHACFRDDLPACNRALTYKYINRADRKRLSQKRSNLLAAKREAADRVRLHDIERQRAEVAQQRHLVEQRAEEERQQHLREQEERRLSDRRAFRQRQKEIERQRAERAQAERRLAEQRAEAERLRRQREKEEQRLAKLRIFGQDSSACRSHDISACERALRSSLASDQDVIELRRSLKEAQTYQRDRTACQTGNRSACAAALASSALPGADRDLLERWHSEAHPVNRAMASVGDLPTSTVITGTLALFLSFALCLIMFRHRAALNGQDDVLPPKDQPDTTAPQNTLRQRLLDLVSLGLETVSAWRSSLNSKPQASEPSPENQDLAKPAPPALRDTPGAIAALELAEAYIEEVREAERPAFDDKIRRRAQLNTLALAAKQLTLAEELDPDAELVISEDQGDIAFTIGALKAKALILEARSYDDHNTRRALPPLRQAIKVDPTNATAHFLLGTIEATNMNRVRAVEALQAAVDLEPENLTFRKELNRAESIGGAEAAAFKATRVGERAYDTGIAAWNIFAVFWNIITFPFRTISTVMRVLARFN